MGKAASWRSDVIILLVAVMLVAAVFANSVSGEFVYDDTKQIVANPLIRESGSFWKALTSDVWAFKGERAAAWSNYWRPTFMLWLMGNYRLFGLEDPRGWHLANIALHALVTLLGYGLLRALHASRLLAAPIVWLFAVHPVHVESVSWISGSPDLLLAAPLLGALWCVILNLRRPRPWRWALALALYTIALGAKEVSILYPGLVLVTVWALERESSGCC